MADIVFSVSQVNDYISRRIYRDAFLKDITVRGEVTNYSLNTNDTAFFALKDENSLLNCILFDAAGKLFDGMADGAEVVARGEIAYYPKSGRLQMYASDIKKEGLGELFLEYIALKKRLEERGYFDESIKKPLPHIVENLGVVTSNSGAALQDIINIATRRFKGINIIVYPAKVQGPGAATEIAKGVDYFNEKKNVDLIVVSRGGGSFEDLFAFNELPVAESIYRSEIPVVSAVGHEIDYTISDLAADMRAPTPSAAAEICIPLKADTASWLDDIKTRMAVTVSRQLDEYTHRLKYAESAVRTHSPVNAVIGMAETVRVLDDRLKTAARRRYDRYYGLLGEIKAALKELNPLNVLKRGFAAIRQADGRFIGSAAALKKDEPIAIVFGDGEADATVTGIRIKEEE